MKFLFVFLLLFQLCHFAAAAPLAFSSIFGDHMVLPCNRAFKVSGTAPPSSEIRIRFAGREFKAKSDVRGCWSLQIPPLKPSAVAKTIRLFNADKVVELKDILIGELWLCAGQSNMDWPLSKSIGGKEAAEAAGDGTAAIRLLNWSAPETTNRAFSNEEIERLRRNQLFTGNWELSSPKSALSFSAVGWWAGLEIHKAKNIPIGLIDCSVGGSGAEAWLPLEIMQQNDFFAPLIAENWTGCTHISTWARGRAKRNLDGRDAPHPYQPGILFENGVAPWKGLPFAGVLWYQGETNAELPDQKWNEKIYTSLFKGWRKVLGQPELPWIVVQLPRIGGNAQIRRHWPEFREMQARSLSRISHSQLVPTSDLGWDSPDVHPPDKKPVGQRVGQAAIALTCP